MQSNVRNRRGITLIELLVTSFVLVIALTVVFGTLINVSKGVRSGQDRLTMQHSAQMIADEILAVLTYALPAQSLDVMPAEKVEAVFESNRIRLMSSQGYAQNGLEWVEMESAVSSYGLQVGIRRCPVGSLMSKESPRIIGLEPARFSSKVEFRYKTDAASNEAVESLTSEQYPQLIEITITISDNRRELPDFILQTAADLL